MGVSGCGKSSVAEALARSFGWTLHEGDRYHAPESVAKMRAGVPLTDDDRADWLDQLGTLLAMGTKAGGQTLACSALRRTYRDRLRAACPGLRFVFLRIDHHEALARVQMRADHFFSPSLVADQFATLESPHGEPGVLVLDATESIDMQTSRIAGWFRA
jgi:gluconokinase